MPASNEAGIQASEEQETMQKGREERKKENDENAKKAIEQITRMHVSMKSAKRSCKFQECLRVIKK